MEETQNDQRRGKGGRGPLGGKGERRWRIVEERGGKVEKEEETHKEERERGERKLWRKGEN